MAAPEPIHPNGHIFMPSLVLLEINEANINYLMEVFDLSYDDIAKQLFNRSDQDCEDLYQFKYDEELINESGIHTLDKYYGGYMVVDMPSDHLKGAGIVGYINIKPKKSIYIHRTTNIRAAVAYIQWTCSLTSSDEETNILDGDRMYTVYDFIRMKLQYYQAQNPGVHITTSINKFLVHHISKLLFNYWQGIDRRQLDCVLLFSSGIRNNGYNTHPAHRAAGKTHACSFLTEWISESDGKQLFDEARLDDDDLVYLWSPNYSTNDLYTFFEERGSDIGDYDENSGEIICPRNSLNNNFEGGKRIGRRRTKRKSFKKYKKSRKYRK